VPLITFSNDTSIAEPDVFVMGHVPEQSIERTVRYARAHGLNRFAALVPNGDYAAFMSAYLKEAGVEPQRTRQRIEHLRRRVLVAALLEPQVVVRADAGQQCDLLTAQARDATSADDGQADHLGPDPLAPGAQERADEVGCRVHGEQR